MKYRIYEVWEGKSLIYSGDDSDMAEYWCLDARVRNKFDVGFLVIRTSINTVGVTDRKIRVLWQHVCSNQDDTYEPGYGE